MGKLPLPKKTFAILDGWMVGLFHRVTSIMMYFNSQTQNKTRILPVTYLAKNIKEGHGGEFSLIHGNLVSDLDSDSLSLTLEKGNLVSQIYIIQL